MAKADRPQHGEYVVNQYVDNNKHRQLLIVSSAMAVIDYQQMARIMREEPQRLKRATRNTLNDLAFLSQKEMTKRAQRDMTFRKSPKRALGFRVKKANYGNLEAKVETTRGWLAYHLEEGTRHASSGLTFKGTNYLVVPVLDKAFTKTKKLKKSYSRRTYIVTSGGDALMFYRAKRKQSVLIATLERRVQHHEDTEPDKSVTDVMQRDGVRILQRELNYQR